MNGGVLIIGSLYWDDDARFRGPWRRKALDMDGQVRVAAPIRYGRCSGSRGHTPTMVFDTSLYRGGRLGQALVVPFRREAQDAGDIFHQARSLWAAEKNGTAETIHAEWGCVGLLVNPRLRGGPALASAWGELFDAPCPSPPVDTAGLLRLRWPEPTLRKPLRLDYLLATATRPTPPVRGYFLPRELADAWIEKRTDRDPHERYFLRNHEKGITTYQDCAIWARFRERKPEWLNDASYAEATKGLAVDCRRAGRHRPR